jgi:hypothetical protein
MPKSKPTLMSIDFGPAKNDEREIDVVWTGTPDDPGPSRYYIGTLRSTRRVSIRDEYGDEQYEWELATIPVTAKFLVPTKEPMDSRPVGAARWMIRAAYRAAGYGLFTPGQADA